MISKLETKYTSQVEYTTIETGIVQLICDKVTKDHLFDQEIDLEEVSNEIASNIIDFTRIDLIKVKVEAMPAESELNGLQAFVFIKVDHTEEDKRPRIINMTLTGANVKIKK